MLHLYPPDSEADLRARDMPSALASVASIPAHYLGSRTLLTSSSRLHLHSKVARLIGSSSPTSSPGSFDNGGKQRPLANIFSNAPSLAVLGAGGAPSAASIHRRFISPLVSVQRGFTMGRDGTGAGGPAAKRHKSTEAPSSSPHVQSALSTANPNLTGRERTLDAIANELGLRGGDGAGRSTVDTCWISSHIADASDPPSSPLFPSCATHSAR